MKDKEFLFFNKKRLQNFLIWFPKSSFLSNSGYLLNLLLYAQIKNTQKPSPQSTTAKKILHNDSFGGSYFYFPTKIQKWRIWFPVPYENSGMNYFLNLKNQNNLKQSLLLEYQPKLADLSNKIGLNSHVGLFSPDVKRSQNKKTKQSEFSRSENRTQKLSEKITKIKTKFFYNKQKNYIRLVPKTKFLEQSESNSTKNIDFLKVGLNRVNSTIGVNHNLSSVFFQEKSGWLYVPITNKVINKFKTSKKLLLLEQGKVFDNLLFLNSKICIQYIPTTKIGLIKSLKNKKSRLYYQIISYSKESFLTHNSFYSEQPNFLEKIQQENYLDSVSNQTKLSESSFSFIRHPKRNYLKSFFYYNLEKGDFKTSTGIINSRTLVRKPQQNQENQQKSTKGFFFVSHLNEFSLPKKGDLIKQWNNMKKVDNSYLTNSPLFIKQQSTNFCSKNQVGSVSFYKNEVFVKGSNKVFVKGKINKKVTTKFQLMLSGSKGWFCSKNIFKLLINLNSPALFKKVNQSYLLSHSLKNHKIPVLGLNLFFYNIISLPVPKTSFLEENVSFYFEIFENRWVIPTHKLTTGFIRITTDGEFRRLVSKQNKSVVSILTKQNLRRLDLSKILSTKDTKDFTKNKQVQIGAVLRSGAEIWKDFASPAGGFILNKNFTQLTIRLGVPFLASARGIIHIFQYDLIQKNDLLMTLKSQRLQTEDIVQGIPKIEQLFEARETQGGTILPNSVHTRLKTFFISSLKTKTLACNNIHENLSKAITDSFTKIQFFLVQSILQAYSSQGVKLSQKHIEIIVRQMTTRVRILAGGDSGLLPGELIQFTRIQKLNNQLWSLGKRPAIYEPIILGITKSVLQSESFLLSASFQEVSRVLVRSALTKKTDFLRGLHENVILGQLVPVGTGLVSTTSKIIEK